MKELTLSVVMPNYNYAKYIGDALEAILSQSFKPLEAIIVDDASTDDSVEVISDLMKKHSNIRLLRNEKNMGVQYTYNRGVEAARGEYVYGAASDDMVLPGFFERSMDLLKQHPEAGLCCSDISYVEGGRTVERRFHLSKGPRYFSPAELLAILKGESITPIVSQTVIVRRDALMSAGGYQPKFRWCCDTFVHHVIGFRQGICYLPEVRTLERRHGSQLGSAGNKLKDDRDVILRQILELDKPGYDDVRPMFRQVAPFSIYPWEVLMVVIANRRSDYFSFKLLRFALYDRIISRFLKRIIPPFLYRVFVRMVELSRYVKYILLKGSKET